MKKKKDPTLFQEPLSVREHIQSLIGYMGEGIYEKEHIMSMALLTAIAGESVFLLGPPGTAKSMVARRLKMVFKNAHAFEYLMSRFSTPDEIFGPVSISKLKNEDSYERQVEGYLPDAEIVFLDEIWKAGPSIQNALLTAINERIFMNGRTTVKLPMKALIAASNELPAEDEGLEALWDRFLVRLVSNCISNEKTFYKMVRERSTEDPVIPEEYLITDDLFKQWQNAICEVEIPDEVCQIVTVIRQALKEEQKKKDVEFLDYYISDRRWKKAFHLMQASAYLNGRKQIDPTDCLLLIHCLWNRSETIPFILETVPAAITHNVSADISSKANALEKLIKQPAQEKKEKTIVPLDYDPFAVTNYFYYAVLGFSKGTCLFAKTDYKYISTEKASDGVLYFDEKNHKWIIHAIYSGTLFNYLTGDNQKIVKIKLQKCHGGLIVDGIPYSFKKKEPGPTALPPQEKTPNSQLGFISEAYDKIANRLTDIKNLFNGCGNLFVSNDDKSLMNKQICKIEKELEELDMKIQNARQFLQG